MFHWPLRKALVKDFYWLIRMFEDNGYAHQEQIDALLTAYPSLANVRFDKYWLPSPLDPDKETPIFIAAAERNLDLIRRLVVLGVDVNIQNEVGITPLLRMLAQGATHAISQERKRKGVELLLELGADPNLADKWGNASLHYFRHVDWNDPHRIPILECLLAHGADVNLENVSGETPFHWSVLYPDIFFIMLDHGGDIHLADGEGKTLLIRAAIVRNEKIVTVLLQHGADITAKDGEGRTGLHYVSEVFPDQDDQYQFSLLPVLLKAGADPNT